MIKELGFKSLAITALAVFSLNNGVVFAAEPLTGIQDAIPVAKSLGGNTKDDGWYNLSGSAKTKTVDGTPVTISGISGGSFPGMAPLPNVISQIKSDADNSATFRKVANGTLGGAMPSTDSLYAAGISTNYNVNGGTLGVYETTPVVDLANIVFQLEIGGASGYDFYQPDVVSNATTPYGGASALQVGALSVSTYFPQLNLTFTNGDTTALGANWAELTTQGYNGTTTAGGSEEPVYINLYAFQWDLSSVENVASFNITFNVAQHSQTYAARLTQSDVFNQVVAVPEPESYAMLLAGLGLIGFAARRRQA